MESYIGDENKDDEGLDIIGNPREQVPLDNGLLLLEQELDAIVLDKEIFEEAGNAKLSLDNKEIFSHIENTDRDVYKLVNDIKGFREDHDVFVETYNAFVESNEIDMTKIIDQLNFQKTQSVFHSELLMRLDTKLDSNSKNLGNSIIGMKEEIINNFNILNSLGQQHNNNSKQENDFNHFANNINSNWENSRRPNLDQLETPFKIEIEKDNIKEENVSKDMSIFNSLVFNCFARF